MEEETLVVAQTDDNVLPCDYTQRNETCEEDEVIEMGLSVEERDNISAFLKSRGGTQYSSSRTFMYKTLDDTTASEYPARVQLRLFLPTLSYLKRIQRCAQLIDARLSQELRGLFDVTDEWELALTNVPLTPDATITVFWGQLKFVIQRIDVVANILRENGYTGV
jgi:hypothetical protein